MTTIPAMQQTSTPRKADADRVKFKADMLKSALSSAFEGVLRSRKRHSGITLQMVADAMNKDKSEISRWFSNRPPNWQISTIAALADCLGVSVDFRLVDQATEEVFTPSGSYLPKKVEVSTVVVSAIDYFKIEAVLDDGSIRQAKQSLMVTSAHASHFVMVSQ